MRVLLAAALLCVCVTVFAANQKNGLASVDGSKLLVWCTGAVVLQERPRDALPDEVIHGAWCSGFIQGVDHMHAASVGSGQPPIWCPPARSASYHQMYRVILQWLRAHPKELHRPAILLTLRALNDSFPC